MPILDKYGVDDYYIKGKSCYNECHFNHVDLIIWYDASEIFSTVDIILDGGLQSSIHHMNVLLRS